MSVSTRRSNRGRAAPRVAQHLRNILLLHILQMAAHALRSLGLQSEKGSHRKNVIRANQQLQIALRGPQRNNNSHVVQRKQRRSVFPNSSTLYKPKIPEEGQQQQLVVHKVQGDERKLLHKRAQSQLNQPFPNYPSLPGSRIRENKLLVQQPRQDQALQRPRKRNNIALNDAHQQYFMKHPEEIEQKDILLNIEQNPEGILESQWNPRQSFPIRRSSSLPGSSRKVQTTCFRCKKTKYDPTHPWIEFDCAGNTGREKHGVHVRCLRRHLMPWEKRFREDLAGVGDDSDLGKIKRRKPYCFECLEGFPCKKLKVVQFGRTGERMGEIAVFGKGRAEKGEGRNRLVPLEERGEDRRLSTEEKYRVLKHAFREALALVDCRLCGRKIKVEEVGKNINHPQQYEQPMQQRIALYSQAHADFLAERDWVLESSPFRNLNWLHVHTACALPFVNLDGRERLELWVKLQLERGLRGIPHWEEEEVKEGSCKGRKKILDALRKQNHDTTHECRKVTNEEQVWPPGFLRVQAPEDDNMALPKYRFTARYCDGTLPGVTPKQLKKLFKTAKRRLPYGRRKRTKLQVARDVTVEKCSLFARLACGCLECREGCCLECCVRVMVYGLLLILLGFLVMDLVIKPDF